MKILMSFLAFMLGVVSVFAGLLWEGSAGRFFQVLPVIIASGVSIFLWKRGWAFVMGFLLALLYLLTT